MHYSMYLCLTLATLPCRDADDTPDTRTDPADAMRPVLDDLLALVESFRRGPVCPTGVATFENDLQGKLRELGRVITQSAFGSLEPAAVSDLPAEVRYESESYRRLGKKTPQQVSTLFGEITVYRLWLTGRHPRQVSRCYSRSSANLASSTARRPPWSSAWHATWPRRGRLRARR